MFLNFCEIVEVNVSCFATRLFSQPLPYRWGYPFHNFAWLFWRLVVYSSQSVWQLLQDSQCTNVFVKITAISESSPPKQHYKQRYKQSNMQLKYYVVLYFQTNHIFNLLETEFYKICMYSRRIDCHLSTMACLIFFFIFFSTITS